ncbi:MAG: hypothetical protein V3V41_03595 [Candidatus Heimdallarchaeota archaeon]
MKHTRLICLILITIFMFTPVLQKKVMAADHPFVEEWDFSGNRPFPKNRQLVIPIAGLDPYRMRTFVYLLNEDLNTSTVETIVAIYGVQPVRNAPHYSTFFEEEKVSGLKATYSFKIDDNSGLSWEIINYDTTNSSLPGYDPSRHFLYDQIRSKLSYRFPELYEDEVIQQPINLAYLPQITGIVGYWQILYEDGTLVNGNFTTYGPTNPIFWGPGQNTSDSRAYGQEDYWPDYNLTVAQNIERSSLPRTHSFRVSFPFSITAAAFSAIVICLGFRKKVRRKNQ